MLQNNYIWWSFFLNQRSDLGGVSNTQAVGKNLALHSLYADLVVMQSLQELSSPNFNSLMSASKQFVIFT